MSKARQQDERGDLTAFCASCPDPTEVARVLHDLGFHLAFSLPADETNAAMRDFLPPLPAQYHFEDQVGTSIVYLAGVDSPRLADEGDEPAASVSSPSHYLPHASRFWLSEENREPDIGRVRETLAAQWGFRWRRDRLAGEVIEGAAKSRQRE